MQSIAWRTTTLFIVALVSVPAQAQQPGQGAYQPPAHHGGGGIPVQRHPQSAATQQVPRPPVLRGAPFQLTKEELQNLHAVLSAWEQQSSKVDLMRCQMTVLAYDTTFHREKPNVLQGELKFQAPDKGYYRVEAQSQQQEASAPQVVEHWICDGKSVFQYDYAQKKVIRRDLPPELRGAGIGDGPLPFFFGAKANKLLHRYFMKLVTPEDRVAKQVWVEAYPRFQTDAANFRRATVILDKESMMPWAVEVYSPSGNERNVHKFSEIQVGKKLWENFFGPDPFNVAVPSGWQMMVNPGAEGGGPAARTARVPAPTGPIRKLLGTGKAR